MRRLTLCLLILALALPGCHWVGKTAGKVQAKVERKTQDVQEGYDEGYKGEKHPQQEQK